jgi:hypothetical protein
LVVLRCTQKLLRKVGPAVPVPSPSTTRLGDWTGNVLGVGHQRVVVFISEHSRLPVVLPARDLRAVAEHLPLGVGAVLKGLGIPEGAVRAEQLAMADALIARTNDRSLVATLNDLCRSLKWRLADEPGVDLTELALWLAETPIGPMKYDAPNRVTRRIFIGDAGSGRAV